MSIEEIQTLPAGWRWVKLGDVTEIISGQSPPGETYRNTPEGLPFFQGKTDFGRRHPIPRMWCVAPVKVAKQGDILISVRAPVGPTNVADQKCCIGRGLAAIRCHDTVDQEFVLAALRLYEADLVKKGSGSTFQAINRDDLLNLAIPLPLLPEQKRIAAILTKKMAAVEKTLTAAEARLKAAKELPAAYLREVFEGAEAQTWPRKRIEEIAELLSSKSIATDGDTEVQAITSACLSEVGFLPTGIKTARMKSSDVPQCIVAPGELLIARSNTPELVGRVSMFEGDPSGVVASDLTIRIMPYDLNNSKFLLYYLSFLYLSGYWKERAGGASGTMKKITRGQILVEKVPVPPHEEQQRILLWLRRKTSEAQNLILQLQDELTASKKLPQALLCCAFAGEL